jgi:hypothetical protein
MEAAELREKGAADLLEIDSLKQQVGKATPSPPVGES